MVDGSRLQCFFLVFLLHTCAWPFSGTRFSMFVSFSWHPNVQDDTENMLQSLQLAPCLVLMGRVWWYMQHELEALQIWLGFLAVFLTLNPGAVFWHRLLFSWRRPEGSQRRPKLRQTNSGAEGERRWLRSMAMESQNLKCVVAYTSICCFTCIPSQPLSFSKEAL